MASIVLIDDNVPLREMLAEVLAKSGHEVCQASDGKHGVNLVLSRPVDLVITDLVMPDQDGMETIMKLRKSHPQLPIIAMSGDAPRHADLYLSVAKKLGAAKILQKPFSVPMLTAAVNGVLGLKQSKSSVVAPE